MAGVNENQGQLVFGLDIGTRSIVGTVGYRKGERFCVAGQRFREHESRAMLDGQIHDIGKVGETIRQVKQQLEADVGRKLTEVCIAAAGRVLRTVTTYAEQDYGTSREITQEDIYSLATMGVEKAYEEFSKVNDTSMKFYCVGYTAMRYYMNGYPIGNLEGHKAQIVGIDLIATFLPDDVVDGLYKAVERADLQVVNLTLEPIAAMQVAIPEKFRMLNMALVDVGAGTSDISITKDGAITAYGMIPVAGDSLTDIIVQHCLVDFDTAEQIKRQAGVQEKIEYTDIMGLPQTIDSREVLSILEESVVGMTKMVADCIRELNGDKAVSAVFVVGGGGIIPGYTESLARELGIVKERVAVRGEEVMQTIEFDMENARKDSLMVTPIGICLCYYDQSNNFIFLKFNQKRIKLYDNGNLMVADAAIQAHFPNEALFPRRGEALTFTVNGKSRILRGQQGEAAVITINGENADIYTKINNGDHIQVIPSTAGENAEMLLGRLPEMEDGLSVTVNGNRITLPKSAAVNGKVENVFYSIQNGDDVLVYNCYTVAQIAALMDIPLKEEGPILVNGSPAKADTKVYENFTVTWEMEGSLSRRSSSRADKSADGFMEAPGDLLGLYEKDREEGLGERPGPQDKKSLWAAEYSREFDVGKMADGIRESDVGKMADGAREFDVRKMADSARESRRPNMGSGTSSINVEKPYNITVMINKSPVTLSGKKSYVFVDIFEFYNFDLSNAEGRIIVTELNGRPAEYMEEIKDGDIIAIYWRKP